MKESRLFQILYYILEREKVTARELSEKFEISMRTVYRDIDWISSAGIPIYTVQGKGGGIAIDSNFVLKKSLLSEEEKEQILISLNHTKEIDELQQRDLPNKLSALFHMKNTHWVEVDFSNWRHLPADQTRFEDIKFSIIHKRYVSFDYSGNTREQKQRKVRPIRLICKAWSWYLYAFCPLRKDFRFFKLSRMNHLKVHDEIYPQDYSNLVIEKKNKEEETVHLKLKFDKSQGFRVYDEFPEQVTEKQGYLWVETDFPSNYLYSYLLSFGEGVEVMEPDEVRGKIKSIAMKLAEKYKI